MIMNIGMEIGLVFVVILVDIHMKADSHSNTTELAIAETHNMHYDYAGNNSGHVVNMTRETTTGNKHRQNKTSIILETKSVEISTSNSSKALATTISGVRTNIKQVHIMTRNETTGSGREQTNVGGTNDGGNEMGSDCPAVVTTSSS